MPLLPTAYGEGINLSADFRLLYVCLYCAYRMSIHVLSCPVVPSSARPECFVYGLKYRIRVSARVAKLVDARDLKSLGLMAVPVRLRARAPSNAYPL